MHAGLQQRLRLYGIGMAKRALVALLGVTLFYVSANATFIYYASSTPDESPGDNSLAPAQANEANAAARQKGFEEKLRSPKEFEQAFYRNHCLLCHNAMGDRQPGLQNETAVPLTGSSAPVTESDYFREKMAARAWASPLNGDDVNAIINYLQSGTMHGGTTTDGTKGQKLYADNCGRCHAQPGGGSVKPVPVGRSQTNGRPQLPTNNP